MPKQVLWLRLVGGFYLLLAGASLWVLFVNPFLFGSMFPFAADATSVRAFSDAWLIFVLDLAVLGAFMVYAARDPVQGRILVQVVAVLELVRGAGGDLLWMSRGWPLTNYIPFMLVHLLIAFSGLYLSRQPGLARA